MYEAQQKMKSELLYHSHFFFFFHTCIFFPKSTGGPAGGQVFGLGPSQKYPCILLAISMG